jgi:hypothetical protein
MEVSGARNGEPCERKTCTVRIDNKLFFPEKCGGFLPGTLARFCFERAERREK